MNLKTKVKTGLKWTFLDQVFSQIIFLIFGIFLARLVSPSSFGLVGMVTIFSNFAVLFIDMGFGAALVQKNDATDEHFSSVFWLNLKQKKWFSNILIFFHFNFNGLCVC